MKKNQKPIKGQKQTPKPKTEKVVNPYAKPNIDLATLQAHFDSLMQEKKPKQAYNIGCDLVRKIEETSGMLSLDAANFYKILGELAGILQEHAAATRHFEKTIKIIEAASEDDKAVLTELYYHTGISFANLKKYDKGISYLQKAIHIEEGKAQNEDNVLTNLCVKIADFYRFNDDFEQAIIFLQKAITIVEKENEIMDDKDSANAQKIDINKQALITYYALLQNALKEYSTNCHYMQMDYSKATIQPYKDFITKHFSDTKA